MKPYQILLGTVDQPDSNKEWALRPFMRTAKNKKNLLIFIIFFLIY